MTASGAHTVPPNFCECAHTVTLQTVMTLQFLTATQALYSNVDARSKSLNAFTSEHRVDSLVSRLYHRNIPVVVKPMKKLIKDQSSI